MFVFQVVAGLPSGRQQEKPFQVNNQAKARLQELMAPGKKVDGMLKELQPVLESWKKERQITDSHIDGRWEAIHHYPSGTAGMEDVLSDLRKFEQIARKTNEKYEKAMGSIIKKYTGAESTSEYSYLKVFYELDRAHVLPNPLGPEKMAEPDFLGMVPKKK
ncbi:MAG: hypothetical protein NT157_00620 [Candidatus Micrarchaeota archaeon]|nr:hypothetical protein [Candidatus Micrarchaeota archaeon]